MLQGSLNIFLKMGHTSREDNYSGGNKYLIPPLILKVCTQSMIFMVASCEVEFFFNLEN